MSKMPKPKKLKDVKMGETFFFGGNAYKLIKLKPNVTPDAAEVLLSNGRKSVVSFGGGIVNLKKDKSGFSDYLKQGGREWD
jgi:hypothetical protein